MESGSDVSTVEHGGMTLTTVGVSSADVKASLAQTSTDGEASSEKAPEKEAKPKKPSVSEAASELGRRGGKAAAEARAAAKEAEPAPKAPSQAAPAEAAEGDEDEEAPLSKRAQQRIEKATREAAALKREREAERREREQERARYEARLAALETRQPQGERQERPQPQRERDPNRPDPKDFESYDEYLDARDSYNRQKWTEEENGRRHAESEVRRYQHHVQKFTEHTPANLREELAPELLEMKPHFLLGDDEPVTWDSILASELVYLGEKAGPVMKHLTDNPDELSRLRALRTHPDMRVEVQVLARSLGSQSDATTGNPPETREQAPKPVPSRAHPPVKPVTGAPHVADGDPMPREDEVNDFDRWNRRQKKRA